AVLVLAGAGRSQTLDDALARMADESVFHLGVLPSFGPLLRSAMVFVCPLRFGAGVKSKILEGVAAGCAIVSTGVGLQGLPDEVCAATLRAASADELAGAVVRLLRDPELAASLRAQVQRVRAAIPTWRDATANLDRGWASVLPGPAVTT